MPDNPDSVDLEKITIESKCKITMLSFRVESNFYNEKLKSCKISWASLNSKTQILNKKINN